MSVRIIACNPGWSGLGIAGAQSITQRRRLPSFSMSSTGATSSRVAEALRTANIATQAQETVDHKQEAERAAQDGHVSWHRNTPGQFVCTCLTKMLKKNMCCAMQS